MDIEFHIAEIIASRTIPRGVKTAVVSKLLKVAELDRRKKCPHCNGTGFAEIVKK